MAVQLLVSDLDGTLLDEQSEMAEETAEAVRKAQSVGIRFVAATGRSWSTAYEIFQKAGISVDFILLNGAEFRNSAGEIIYQEAIEDVVAQETVNTLMQKNLDMEVNTDRGEFSTNTKVCWKASEFSELIQIKGENPQILKIFVFSENLSDIEKYRQELFTWSGLSVTSSADWNIEITSKEAQKGKMLEKVMKFYQISREEVVVFGDGYNDESMFRRFCHSRAMKNAVPLIHHLAEKVIDSNKNHGVAKEIHKIILGGMQNVIF